LANSIILDDAKSYTQALKIAQKQDKRVLMYMYSEYCSWCKKMKKTTLSNKRVIDYIKSNYIFIKVDVDMGDYPEELRASFLPTTHIIDPYTQKSIQKVSGYKTVDDFLDELWSN